MRIGQIVFINDSNLPNVQTGIITKREIEDQGMYFWYEVFCNDGQNHVIPAFLLSPAPARVGREYKNNAKKLANFVQACTKITHDQLNYIHNQKQNNNFHSQK